MSYTTPTPQQLRGTDEAFYQMMQLSGAALLKLLGFPTQLAESYQFRAVEYKQKRLQRPDIEAIPMLEGADTRALIEFQGYVDKHIRFRALRNMLEAYEGSPEPKPIISIIIYTEAEYQAAALPISAFMPDITDNALREVVLINYTEQQLLATDPRLILLSPFTLGTDIDKQVLAQKSSAWTQQICAVYADPQQQAKALNIFGLLLFDRFKNLNQQEVTDMLNIDLMQSRAVQEVFNKGIQQGLAQGKQSSQQQARDRVTQLLQQRFGNLPADIHSLLQSVTDIDALMQLFLIAHSCNDIAEFVAYCQAQANTERN